MLTDSGVEKVEKLLSIHNLYDPQNLEWNHHVQQALRAHSLYKKDVNYMVTDDGKVVIIDEFTGRLMPGRRWSDGLHQATPRSSSERCAACSTRMTFQPSRALVRGVLLPRMHSMKCLHSTCSGSGSSRCGMWMYWLVMVEMSSSSCCPKPVHSKPL